MIRGISGLLVAATIGSMGVLPVGAHHSIAKFDGSRVVRVSGVVASFRWINPHASVEIESPRAAGEGGGRWIVEMMAPTSMMGEGWTRALHPEDLTRWLAELVGGCVPRDVIGL